MKRNSKNEGQEKEQKERKEIRGECTEMGDLKAENKDGNMEIIGKVNGK